MANTRLSVSDELETLTLTMGGPDGQGGWGLSQEISYDVYVESGIDLLGPDDFGPAVAHFVERGNAVALKRRLEARGQKVHVERSTVYDLSEAEKEVWFSDYSRVPEFELAWDQVQSETRAPSQGISDDSSEEPTAAIPHVRPGAPEASKASGDSW